MRISGFVLAAVVSSGALFTSAPAQAQLADIFGGNLLSAIGLTSPEKPEIDYRDRAPLVVPPRSTLPPPQESAASRTGNWPNDPNSARNREARAAAEAQIWEEKIRRGDTGARLSAEEIQRVRARAARTAPDSFEQQPGSIYTTMRLMRENDLRRASESTAELPLGAEPPRRQLTQPPPGLRAATQRARVPVDTNEAALGNAPGSGEREFIAEQARR